MLTNSSNSSNAEGSVFNTRLDVTLNEITCSLGFCSSILFRLIVVHYHNTQYIIFIIVGEDCYETFARDSNTGIVCGKHFLLCLSFILLSVCLCLVAKALVISFANYSVRASVLFLVVASICVGLFWFRLECRNQFHWFFIKRTFHFLYRQIS